MGGWAGRAALENLTTPGTAQSSAKPSPGNSREKNREVSRSWQLILAERFCSPIDRTIPQMPSQAAPAKARLSNLTYFSDAAPTHLFGSRFFNNNQSVTTRHRQRPDLRVLRTDPVSGQVTRLSGHARGLPPAHRVLTS
jgi:hypothetical protein